MQIVKLSLCESVSLTAKPATTFGENARIVKQKEITYFEKLSLFRVETVTKITKQKKCKCQTYRVVICRKDDLFDISFANALDLMIIEDKPNAQGDLTNQKQENIGET